MNHPFFKDIDFEKLEKRELLSPYIPKPEQYSYKDEEKEGVDAKLLSIGKEEESDKIPEDKKLLIEMH